MDKVLNIHLALVGSSIGFTSAFFATGNLNFLIGNVVAFIVAVLSTVMMAGDVDCDEELKLYRICVAIDVFIAILAFGPMFLAAWIG